MGPTVFAVDWSGARRPKGIWLAAIHGGRLVASEAMPTREAAIERVAAEPGPVIAGFDFSFSVPMWFARELGCATVDDVWTHAGTHGEAWLRPSPPFWRDRCTLPVDRRFRRCEERFPTAKSIFQLVGNGQVGAGSVRGMPLLPRLRAAGFAIWPFDAPGDRVAFEIYPRALVPLAGEQGPFRTSDERDAVCSAIVLWHHRHQVARLAPATDAVGRIEGDVWVPVSDSDR